MITFRRVTVLFFILLLSLNLVHFLGCRMEWLSGHICSHGYIYLLVLISLYISISVIMAFIIGSNFHHSSICQGLTNEKLCALTFDDSPNPANTPAILTILKREQLTATFFVIGKKISGNESLIHEIFSAGHLIGNHSWSHSPWFDFFTAKRMKRELTDTAKAISDITGRSPLLFRPPFGVINPALSRAINMLSYHVIGWNVRSFDTVHQDSEKTTSRILRKVTPGSIILLHDHLAISSQLLEKLISGLKRKGYNIVPLDQLIHIEAYA